MLLSGFNHVAVLTGDTERFLEFYGNVFDATSEVVRQRDGFRLTLVWVGHTADGLDAEVCVTNPDAQPGVHNAPGTPSMRYHPAGQ